MTEVEKIKSPLDEGTISTDVDLVSAKALLGANRRTGTVEATDTNLLKNTNLSNITETPIVVRNDGIVSQNIKDRGAEFIRKIILVVEGSRFDVVKIIFLQTYWQKYRNPFKVTDTLDDEVFAVERLAQRTKLLEKKLAELLNLMKRKLKEHVSKLKKKILILN